MHSWQIGTGSGRAGFQVLSSVDFYLPSPLTPFLLLFPISRNQQYINHLNSWSMGFFRQPHATRLQSSIIFRVIFFLIIFKYPAFKVSHLQSHREERGEHNAQWALEGNKGGVGGFRQRVCLATLTPDFSCCCWSVQMKGRWGRPCASPHWERMLHGLESLGWGPVPFRERN